MAWSDKILSFLENLEINNGILPKDILPLFPLKGENAEVTNRIVQAFYKKFYADERPRRMIIGINPGRLGAGATGIPFTDTKRLKAYCGIDVSEFATHEPSSVFMYDMILAYGGPRSFYQSYYITSVCSIGFVRMMPGGKAVNYNYYDDKRLANKLESLVAGQLEEQIKFGVLTDKAFCLGTGKNFAYLEKLNAKYHFFDEVVPLEHPRYIMQYRLKRKDEYIRKYLDNLI